MASMEKRVPRTVETMAENRANLMKVMTGFEGMGEVFGKIFENNPLPPPEVTVQPQQRGIFTPTPPKAQTAPGKRRRGRMSTVLSAASEEGLGG